MNGKQEENLFLKECMTTALLELMKEKPLASVTITEITARAGVSRMAFYRNYKSKEHILLDHVDWLIKCYHREVAEHGRHRSFIQYENILLGFKYFRENSELFYRLIENDMGEYLRDALLENEFDLILDKDSTRNYYTITAYANALYGVYFAWLKNGMKDQEEDLARLLCDIFKTKVKRY